jgi:hypothetical protein
MWDDSQELRFPHSPLVLSFIPIGFARSLKRDAGAVFLIVGDRIVMAYTSHNGLVRM